MNGLSKLAARLAPAAALAAAFAGCGDDVGACDAEAAQQLVYGRGGLVATKGQALLHDSCGNAAFCHSARAHGDTRFGAPADLDFDMLPQPTGWTQVMANRDEIWSVIMDGEMPPSDVGDTTVGDGDWRFDLERSGDASASLSPLATHEGKSALRNWLACGAPVVAETQAPVWAVRPRDGGAAAGLSDFRDIFEQVIGPECATAGCHAAPGAGGLVLIDECDAYAQLLAVGNCQGRPRLLPGDGGSYLLEKLTSSAPACGGPMPPLAPLPSAVLDEIVAWVEDGAPADNCEAP